MRINKGRFETARGIAYLQIPGQSAPPLVGSQVSLGSSSQVLPSGHCAPVMPPQAWPLGSSFLSHPMRKSARNRDSVAILNGMTVTSLWGYVPHVLTRPPSLHRSRLVASICYGKAGRYTMALTREVGEPSPPGGAVMGFRVTSAGSTTLGSIREAPGLPSSTELPTLSRLAAVPSRGVGV